MFPMIAQNLKELQQFGLICFGELIEELLRGKRAFAIACKCNPEHGSAINQPAFGAQSLSSKY